MRLQDPKRGLDLLGKYAIPLIGSSGQDSSTQQFFTLFPSPFPHAGESRRFSSGGPTELSAASRRNDKLGRSRVRPVHDMIRERDDDHRGQAAGRPDTTHARRRRVRVSSETFGDLRRGEDGREAERRRCRRASGRKENHHARQRYRRDERGVP